MRLRSLRQLLPAQILRRSLPERATEMSRQMGLIGKPSLDRNVRE
jgi:hypothetical protein